MTMWSSAIAWIMTLTLSLLAVPLAAEAPPVGTRRLGLLETSSPDPARLQLWETLRQRLRELGYVDGQTIAFVSRFGEGQPDQLPGLVAELVGLQVDVLVTAGTPATQAAKQATRTIPIVMTMVADPVGAGLVASLGHPGGNVTGLTNQDADLGGKRLELLLQVVPRDTRLALLIDETNPGTVRIAQGTQAAAGALGVPLQSLGVRDPDELERAFAAMQEARAGALIVEPSSMLFTWRTRLADLALQHRLPTVFAHRQYAEAGGLMGYGTDPSDLFRRAATFVDKILKGAKPADLPVEQPTKFAFVINLKTAKALGLTIPPTLLFQADEVIR
jgi:putative tryptophan/tyrosine transport system substrate-binding protein